MPKTIELDCSVCAKKIIRPLKQYKSQSKKSGPNYKIYCSRECSSKAQTTSLEVKCFICEKVFVKRLSFIATTAHNFCSHVCGAVYTNQIRCSTKGLLKEIKCFLCGKQARVALNARAICSDCRPTAPNVSVETLFIRLDNDLKNLEESIPYLLYDNCSICNDIIIIENKRHKKKLCEHCKLNKSSDDALSRVNSDKNRQMLTSIRCDYYYHGNIIRCDSKVEYSGLNYIENNFQIKDMKRSDLILKYELGGKIRKYNPDFEILLEDGKTMIVECKTILSSKDLQRKWKIYYSSIQPKKEALQKYCQENNFEYLFYNKDMNKKFYNSLSKEILSACGPEVKTVL